jgi:hypothetical protein
VNSFLIWRLAECKIVLTLVVQVRRLVPERQCRSEWKAGSIEPQPEWAYISNEITPVLQRRGGDAPSDEAAWRRRAPLLSRPDDGYRRAPSPAGNREDRFLDLCLGEIANRFQLKMREVELDPENETGG